MGEFCVAYIVIPIKTLGPLLHINFQKVKTCELLLYTFLPKHSCINSFDISCYFSDGCALI